MSAETAVLDRLGSVGAATLVVGPPPDDSPLPSAWVRQRSAEPLDRAMGGGWGSMDAEVEVGAVAETAATLRTLRDAVRTALDGQAWTATDGTEVEWAELSDEGETDADPDLGLVAAVDSWRVVVKR